MRLGCEQAGFEKLEQLRVELKSEHSWQLKSQTGKHRVRPHVCMLCMRDDANVYSNMCHT